MASFMETYGMPYDEVLHMPYRLMLMLQHDRIRVDYGSEGRGCDRTEKISGKEMMERRMGKHGNN
jgi:hypothetical protein